MSEGAAASNRGAGRTSARRVGDPGGDSPAPSGDSTAPSGDSPGPREDASASRESTEVRSVYVHAPFCARRCVYCDFAVSVRRSGDTSAWLAALTCELEQVRTEGLFTLAAPLETLYVGGGTPSLLGPDAMRGLSDLLPPGSLTAPGLEWTVEANPESFTPDVAEGWARAGVNRLSLGLQTFHEETLRWMGRLHGSDGPVQALANARAAGIDDLSVDLIFGVPVKLGRSWADDLQRVADLDVPHVSLYGLTVEPATALGRAVEEGREAPVDEDQYHDEYLRASEFFTDLGYVHYEVSNFARPGAEARHNAVYWSGRPYVGLGNGAHSFAPPVRRWNVRDWEEYHSRALSGASVEGEREVIDAAARALEMAWLGLRTSAGVARPTPGTAAEGLVAEWAERGYAVLERDRVRLTPRGWLLLDRLTVELDHVLASG